MLVALAKIKTELKKDIPLIHINDIIWLLGQSKKEGRKPYHLTRTTSY
ncbi:MAG: hypothetical protein PHN72_05140 [Bacilli bacterium]|nr:hypothetical protein [Bacilli bacterium]